MKKLPASKLFDTAVSLFCACGVPVDDAKITARELIEANLFGLDSHGFIRCIFYTQEIAAKRLIPGKAARIIKETPTTAVVDGQLNFGQVTAGKMVEVAARKAKESHISCVVSQHAHHVGRLGAYTARLAEQGFLALAMCNGYKMGHFVAPYGGCEGRLATNPFSYAVPGNEHPLVLDMSTSMIAEGKIKVLLHEGKELPPESVIGANGRETREPAEFYGPPRGAILPFGGALGYKGFGLGLMVEFFGGLLGGAELSDEYTYLNGLCLIAIDPEAFCGAENFKSLLDNYSKYCKSARLAENHREIIMPGEYDYAIRAVREKEGIPVPESVWNEIAAIADAHGLKLESYDDIEA